MDIQLYIDNINQCVFQIFWANSDCEHEKVLTRAWCEVTRTTTTSDSLCNAHYVYTEILFRDTQEIKTWMVKKTQKATDVVSNSLWNIKWLKNKLVESKTITAKK